MAPPFLRENVLGHPAPAGGNVIGQALGTRRTSTGHMQNTDGEIRGVAACGHLARLLRSCVGRVAILGPTALQTCVVAQITAFPHQSLSSFHNSTASGTVGSYSITGAASWAGCLVPSFLPTMRLRRCSDDLGCHRALHVLRVMSPVKGARTWTNRSTIYSVEAVMGAGLRAGFPNGTFRPDAVPPTAGGRRLGRVPGKV